MTQNRGCRDRLLKLSTQIQNTWAKQDVVLRVNRAWIQPPPQYKPKPVDSNSAGDTSETDAGNAESLLYNHDSSGNEGPTTSHMPHAQQTVSTSASAPAHRTAGLGRTQSGPDMPSPPIIDMTPEMMVDENRPDSIEQTSSGRSHPVNIHYDYLSLVPPPSPIPTLSKWSAMQNYRFGSHGRIHSSRFDRPHIQPAPLRYNPSNMDFQPPAGRPYRGTSATKMMRLPRHINPAEDSANETKSLESNTTRNGRKVGRSVYSLPMPLDTGYTSVNTMSQLAFEQWLQMRMEEFHYAGRAVDVQLVSRAGYINMRNPEFSLGVLAQIAYYVAQFDWCYFSRSGHVHCSVKPGECLCFCLVSCEWIQKDIV
ncbi:unnamed protein product [Echinostoma caproni]|uniref:HH_signal domain-containing protein n=1 Tax=Echinostoma caproni TaxID=27848 RepID=A0A183A607_9TREM|nr:unnamed protein product [Echinostoma caproni]